MARRKTEEAPAPAKGPEAIGSISAVELSELRARTRTLSEIKAQAEMFGRMFTIAINEKRNLSRELVRKYHPEATDDDFALDEDTGAILRFGKSD